MHQDPVRLRSSKLLQKEVELIKKAVRESEKHLKRGNILSEKLLRVKAEVAQLEAQNASTIPPLVAENHRLQQELDALKGQLESERNARKHSQMKEPKKEEEITNLTMRLEEARKQLSEETDARSREERNAQQQRHEWETQRTALESKLGSLQQQLKSTEDKLREAKSNERSADSRTENRDGPRPQPRATPSQQRSSVRYDADMAIGTPGLVQAHVGAKKPAALPGDKSAFSITPFLNRTIALPDPQLSSENESEELPKASETERKPSKTKTSDRGRIGNPKRRLDPQDPQDSPSVQNLSTHEPKRVKVSSQINPFTEPHRSDSGDQPNDPSIMQDQSIMGPPMGKPKQRKLGVQRDNSPDDDPGTIMKPSRKLALGAGRKPAVSRLQQPDSPGVSRLARLGRVFSGTDFSPLRRDRR